jgi:hypothetical protein
VLTINSGHSSDYLLDAVAAGRENYYSGAVAAGEPPGRWYGPGAEALGLTGEVAPDVMRAVFDEFRDPRDPTGLAVLGNLPRNFPTAEERFERAKALEPNASPERLEELAALAECGVRNNIGFYDATFSPPKSVTVVHAAFESMEVAARGAGDDAAADKWAAKRMLVEEAIWEGNRAAMNYLMEHAGYTRVGDHSGAAGRWVDAHDWVVASFFQHDSRTHDPQLHIHNPTLNRVQGPDGKWRTLSGQDLNLAKRGAGTVGDRAMFEHLAAESGLPSAMRPDGKSRELVGVDQKVMDHFSTRGQAITPRIAEMAAEYERTYGRAPNKVQMARFNQRATLETRPAKEHTGETSADRLARWDRELRTEIGSGLAAVAETVSKLAGEPLEPRPFDLAATVETALAAAQAGNSRLTTSAVLAEVDAALPDYLGGLSGAETHSMLRKVTMDALASDPVLRLRADGPGEESVPAELRTANGRSSFIQPESDLFATKEHVRSERALQAAAVERGAAAMSPELAEFFTTELAELGFELGVDQRAAVQGVLTDGAKLSALVGPAGSGKSFTVGALAKAWQDPSLWNGEQHRAFGLASSQVATEVLAGDGLETRNVARWLATQERLAAGGTREDDVAWQLAAGDLVLIDESAMANTSDITRIRERVETAGGKLLLTGDHRQLAAVGAGGGMGLVAGTGMSYELTEARRFNAKWEAAASLRLREGDDTALGEYRKHGRILDGGTAEQAATKATRAYVADTLDDKRTLLIADTNEAAAGLSAAVRADLIRLGRVVEAGVPVGKLGATAGVGDVVQARRNAWDLAGYEGNRRGPVNREQYKVAAVREDGGLVVDHVGERMVLPPWYAKDVELGYASTVHSAQGLTVDTSHTVASARTGPQAFYVEITRGTQRNTAYVETVSVPPDSPPGAVHDAVHRDPVAVLAGSLELAQPDRAAVEEMEASAAEMGSVVTAGERFACVSEMAVAGRTAALLDRLTDEGKLTDLERRRLAADQGTPMLSTLLRQVEVAGHDPEHVLTEAVTANSLDSARSIASVLHDRVTRSVPSLEPKGDSHENWVPKVADPAMTAHLQDLAKAADDRRDVLGEQAVAEGPQWAVEALGAVPDEEAARAQWTRAAGVVAAHRERTGHDAEGEALPSPPSPGRVEEYASWWAGWRALGRPDTDVEERELSDGQLRMRVRAMERENAWQPPYVARELSGTTQAAETERQTAVIRGAEASAATDGAERARLEAESAEAAARAEELAEQAKQLEHADTVRAQWYAHTANTRAGDQRARLELSRRGVDVDDPSGRVTARELLEAQSLGIEVDDLRREVTAEHDLAEMAAARDQDTRVFDDRVGDGAETGLMDVRESSQGSVAAQDGLGDWTQVPDAREVAEDVDVSTSARAEVEQRATLDLRANEDEQDRDEPRWSDVAAEPVADQREYADVDQ